MSHQVPTPHVCVCVYVCVLTWLELLSTLQRVNWWNKIPAIHAYLMSVLSLQSFDWEDRGSWLGLSVYVGNEKPKARSTAGIESFHLHLQSMMSIGFKKIRCFWTLPMKPSFNPWVSIPYTNLISLMSRNPAPLVLRYGMCLPPSTRGTH